MSHYISAILKNLKGRFDDDTVDKFNYYYTSTIILVFAVLVSAKQYVGYPIQCWVPAHFTEAMEQYTENYCWVQNTWFLPLDEHVPKVFRERERTQLIYYQWVPFILLLQAMMFQIPCFTWRLLYWHTGLDIQTIVAMASEARSMMDEPIRTKTLNAVAKYINDSLDDSTPKIRPSSLLLRQVSPYSISGEKLNPSKKDVPPTTMSKRLFHRLLTLLGSRQRKSGSGLYVTIIYLFIKCLYSLNLIFQFALLYFFLGANSPLFGMDLLRDLAANRDWFITGLFPRVTLCDFEVVQETFSPLFSLLFGVLMINMFNEKIFLFLWFWFAFLLILTLLNAVVWMVRLLAPEKRIFFIRKHLKFHEMEYRLNDDERKLLDKFACNYLRHDGVFLLTLLSHHAGHVVLNEVIAILWLEYRHSNLQNLLPPGYSYKDFAGSPFSSVLSTADKSFDGLLLETGDKDPLLDQQTEPGGSEVSSFREVLPTLERMSSRLDTKHRPFGASVGTTALIRAKERERAEQRERAVMTGDRDLRKHGIGHPGKKPAKELKLAQKSMFKSGKFDLP